MNVRSSYFYDFITNFVTPCAMSPPIVVMYLEPPRDNGISIGYPQGLALIQLHKFSQPIFKLTYQHTSHLVMLELMQQHDLLDSEFGFDVNNMMLYEVPLSIPTL